MGYINTGTSVEPITHGGHMRSMFVIRNKARRDSGVPEASEFAHGEWWSKTTERGGRGWIWYFQGIAGGYAVVDGLNALVATLPAFASRRDELIAGLRGMVAEPIEVAGSEAQFLSRVVEPSQPAPAKPAKPTTKASTRKSSRSKTSKTSKE